MKEKKVKVSFGEQLKRNGNLFIFYIPAVLFAILFYYTPMLGLVMAFKENPNLFGSSSALAGILEANWVGLKNFKTIFSNPQVLNALRNTLIISTMKILIVFPIPIVLAILISEMKGKMVKKSLQLTMYLPYFLSWATIGGIFIAILNKETGLVNNILEWLGHGRFNFVTSNASFRSVIVSTTAWKDIGWSTITYLAAITALDRNQIEAAKIDGASKWQQIKYITLPGIMPVVAVMFILRIGFLMDAGFEQVFVFYSPFVQETGDILGTYTYRLIRQSALIPQYALSTAVGFFNSIVALMLVVGGNFISKKFFNKGIW
ncbi:ABC transporter permease subunit [Anaerocolumna aminovalerica]|uniref:ABC transporter permease n=1 Tax=Anaerocolumna aminovalerica TaxID=1527 RepID=UPI001C0F0AF1|nr:ABC transporter permease subunit [Anaerocolumna aminovalerica]MBU5331850.1 ABC transporter permease subunit [Anaerocolumna aminovalerica]